MTNGPDSGRESDSRTGREAGASVLDRPVTTPLIDAARRGDADTIKALLANPRTDVNAQEAETGLTALHYAVAYRARPVVLLLTADRSCDLTVADKGGRTPATIAFEVADYPALGRFLLRKEMQQRRASASPPQP